MKADLHMHTTESDGRLTREQLFKHAKKRGVDMIAITDHDTCKHVDDNYRLANKYGVNYIPGIELSTIYKGKNVHILGYFRDDSYASEGMLKYYRFIKEGRENRAKQFIKNLKKHYDIEIVYQDLLDVSHGIIARPHIAKAIIKHYPKYTHNEVFDKFLGDHTEAFVPSTELSTKEGIELLRRHNAVIILAHPILLKKHIHDDVLAYDYDGIEAIYGLHDTDEMIKYKAIAEERNWLITAGSDYHGIPNDTKHRDVGDVTLQGDDLNRFLEALNEK